MYLQTVQIAQSCALQPAASAGKTHGPAGSLPRPTASTGETISTTQEFLAQMLGSRRSTVTVAAGQLQREGLIDYTRGRVRITNRPMLEAKACECYKIVCTAYDRLAGSRLLNKSFLRIPGVPFIAP